MSNKEKVIKLLRELCPETMELSFGCEVLLEDMSDFPNYIGTYVGERFNHETDKFENLCLHPHGDKVYPLDRKYTVIGHPLTLADVLRAIKECKKFDEYTLWGNEILEAHEEYDPFTNNDKIGYHSVGFNNGLLLRWNLSKNLEEQSPEVFDFLAGVLIK